MVARVDDRAWHEFVSKRANHESTVLALSSINDEVIDLDARDVERVGNVFDDEHVDVDHANMVSLDSPSGIYAPSQACARLSFWMPSQACVQRSALRTSAS